MRIKLSAWAKQNNITYTTAYSWFKSGKLPANATQLPSGTILVEIDDVTPSAKSVIYARVSSHDQKADLERQLQRLRDYAANQGILIDAEYTEIGSGVNPKRKNIIKILSDPTIKNIIVENRDRFTRFGFELIEATLKAQSRKVTILNASEVKNDLVQDMIEIMTSFCARLYGKRGAKNRAQKAIKKL